MQRNRKIKNEIQYKKRKKNSTMDLEFCICSVFFLCFCFTATKFDSVFFVGFDERGFCVFFFTLFLLHFKIFKPARVQSKENE